MTSGRNGYAIGVDLGTSNTVAVLRWPDGRTRPLLFDGQPILPSAVYLDEGGRLHVGRDAQRLALLDPSRYEPNPKRRIDEGTVLLGDREGPVVGLLSTILQTIAAKATEACGLLPPAVITYPASWAAARRGILQEAVRRAGWREARLLPEPIAAARYFADSLHRPVPEGGYLAVFDFGGGTLDIAVVQNQHGSFQVIGSGGAEDLGGLDFDAALVDHLGRLLAERRPEVWRQLSVPATPTDRRHRRLFWEDVRGAKEMLSRAAVAPVPIPGVDQALHLTREEFERLARPLLERAVQETAAVISQAISPRRDEAQPEWMPAAGQEWGPGQLAGIFLVGGTSRIPLVSQMLHTRFGFAPTVLEQPELPVAEGALAELVASNEVSEHQHVGGSLGAAAGTALAGPTSAPPAGAPGSPPPGAPISPGAPMFPGGPTPPGPYPPAPPPYGAHPPWPGPSRGRRRWAYLTAVALATVVVVVVGLYALTQAARGFDPLKKVDDVPYTGDVLGADIQDGWAYLAVQQGETAPYKLRLTGVNLSDPEERWTETLPAAESWRDFGAQENFLVVYGTHSGEESLHVLSREDGEQIYQQKVDGATYSFYEDRVIRIDSSRQQLKWFDVNSKNDVGTAGYVTDQFYRVGTWAAESESAVGFNGGRFADPEPDDRVVTVDSSGTIRALNADDGKSVPDLSDGTMLELASTHRVMAYEGKLFVAGQATDSKGYQLYMYDLAMLGNRAKTVYRHRTEGSTVERIEPCGETAVCLVDSERTLTAVDFAGDGELWRKKLGESTQLGVIKAIDEAILVHQLKDEKTRTVVYDDEGTAVNYDGVAMPVDGHTALRFAPDAASVSEGAVSPGTSPISIQIDGVSDVSSEDTSLVGSLTAYPNTCAWDDAYLVCANETNFLLRNFRR
ncbi:MAG: Hsp70 family protein [Micromonosporaceae bacterium]